MDDWIQLPICQKFSAQKKKKKKKTGLYFAIMPVIALLFWSLTKWEVVSLNHRNRPFSRTFSYCLNWNQSYGVRGFCTSSVFQDLGLVPREVKPIGFIEIDTRFTPKLSKRTQSCLAPPAIGLDGSYFRKRFLILVKILVRVLINFCVIMQKKK